jgi:hypothetical protein
MPLGHWNLEWLNHNGQRHYPLADDADGVDETGTFRLPESFLLALYFPVHAGLDVQPDKFFLSRLSLFPTGYSVSIGYDDGTSDPPVAATAVIARNSHAALQSYALPGAGDFDDCLGKIVIGRTDEIDLQPAGEYTFTPAEGRLDTDAIRPMLRGVSSLAIVSGAERSARLYGDVRLRAGTNMKLTIASVDPAATTIRIDAIDGAGLNESCECDGDTPPAPIRTIDGIPPDAQGNFNLVAAKCVELPAIDNGLRVVDTCSDPCCGCPELEKLTEELRHFDGERVTLTNFLANLKAQVDTMDGVVLASRLGAPTCASF